MIADASQENRRRRPDLILAAGYQLYNTPVGQSAWMFLEVYRISLCRRRSSRGEP